MSLKYFFAAFLTLIALPLPASAQEAQTEIVFDASRSMNDLMGQSSKLDEAKKAMSAVVEQISADSQVGLRIFGKNPVKNNVRESCLDSKLVVPIQVFDKQAMLDEVVGLAANGQTALGYSLKLAGQDFSPGADVKRTVILISDGEESCGMDPINVIGELKARGINFVVHAIGFGVDPKTQAQLKQITNMTGGTYQDAANGVQLQESIQKVAVQEKIVDPAKVPAGSMDAAAPKKEEPAEKTPEEKLLRAGRSSGDNLLAATAGAKIVSANSEDVAYAIDGSDEADAYLTQGETAVFAFKDNQPVLLEAFAVPVVEKSDSNVAELYLSGSVDSPETGFAAIATVRPKNEVDFKNVNQEFKIDPPAPVRYLRVQVGPSASGYNTSLNREWRAYGKILSETDFAAALKTRKAVERNLLAKEAGGRLIASSDPSFAAFIDGIGEAPGESAWIETEQEAVFGFSQDKMALLSNVAVPIFESASANCKAFEISVSETSPSEFVPVGTFKTQNLAIMGNPYQAFKFPAPVKAKYLKVKLLEGHGSNECELPEVQANGVFQDEAGELAAKAVSAVAVAPPPAPAAAPAEAPAEEPQPEAAAPEAAAKQEAVAPEAPAEKKEAAEPASEETETSDGSDFYNDFEKVE